MNVYQHGCRRKDDTPMVCYRARDKEADGRSLLYNNW